MECDVSAQVIATLFAIRTATAWHSGLDGHDVAWFQVSHSLTNFMDFSARLVSQDHGIANDEVADSAMTPVMDIRSANADRKAFQDDLCIVGHTLKVVKESSWLVQLVVIPFLPGLDGRGICFSTNSPGLIRTADKLSGILWLDGTLSDQCSDL